MQVNIDTFCIGIYETNCYLLSDKNHAVLIDAGNELEGIFKKLKENNLILEWLINTHGHIDHIGGNDRVRKETGAGLLIHSDDEKMLYDPFLNLSGYFSGYFTFDKPTRVLENDEIINIGSINLKVIHTPGHTPGSISLFLEPDIIFSGDTIFSNGIGRTDFPYGDYENLITSIKKLCSFPEKTKFYPGHGEQTTVYGVESWLKLQNL
ncbi:TPA: MBL fold metallo-hydrolase [bacterium]|nr:MBL fold metallo-hydrolase [bacterium]